MQVSSSSDNTYTSAAYSNKGISGMNSGLDTESLVKSMMSDIQTKIDKQEQKQKVLEMQQEQYRDVVDKINEFKDKYFSVTGEKSLVLSSTFKSTTTESTSSAVKAVSTSDAVEGSFDVIVKELASEAKFTGTSQASSGMEIKIGGIESAGINSSAGKTMTMSAGGSTFDVDISGATSASDMADMINKGIKTYNRQNSSANVDITASVGSDGKLKFSGAGASAGLSVDGVSVESSAVKPASVSSGKFDKSKLAESDTEYKFKVDGTDVSVQLNKNLDDDQILDRLNTALSGKGVTVSWDGSGDD